MTDETKAFIACLVEAGLMCIGHKIGGGVGFALWLLATAVLAALIYAEDCREKASNPKQRKAIKQKYEREMDELRKDGMKC